MKKTLTAVAIALSSIVAHANTKTVEVVWPFAPGGTQATMIRHLLENANAAQKDYQFLFVNKPGAGGSIAVNSVANSNNLAVLASAATFYTRPLLYKESHDVDKFNILSQVCENAPFGLFSKKYKSLSEMQGKKVSVGIIPGSPGHIFSVALAKAFKDITIVEIPYKDTVAASTDMLGQHVDASIDLLSEGTIARMPQDVTIVAVSGTEKVGNATTEKALSNMTAGYWFFIPKSVDKAVQKDLNRIFTSAIDSKVKGSCAAERGTIIPVAFEKLDELHETNKKNWKNLTAGIKVE
jgi:tripartite-type tricarboxylate transporter receptor subunit TctC